MLATHVLHKTNVPDLKHIWVIPKVEQCSNILFKVLRIDAVIVHLNCC